MSIALHRKDLLAFITPWVGGQEVAEDLFHAAFVRAMEKRGAVLAEAHTLAWFRKVLRNVAIDHLRRVGAGRRAVELWSRDLEWNTQPLETSTSRSCRCVEEQLLRLRPSYEDVLRRVDLNDEPIAEIARDLGTSSNNIRVRLHRARAAIRSSLLAVCDNGTPGRCADCRCRDSADRHGGQSESCRPKKCPKPSKSPKIER